jgi:tetratricopeptide (TPR) repeat protein
MAKVGRNDLCPCGSGKKFKKCCMALGDPGDPRAKRDDSTDVFSEIADLVLDPAEDSKRRGVAILKEALSKLAPDSQDWINASSLLVKAYQNLGEHRLALETISSLPQDPVTMISKGISLSALGEHAEACEVVGTAVNSMAFRKLKRRVRTYLYLDVGKVSGLAGDAVQSAKFYELARTGLGSSPDDRNHYARATANLGFILLHSPDPKEQSKGLAFIDQSSDIKAETGDLEGLGTNYNQLSLYYRKLGRFQPALAYTRRDLSVSRKIGDQRGIASSLLNLAGLYLELKQLSPARRMLQEAAQIGERIKDTNLSEGISKFREHIDGVGRRHGIAGEKVGPTANCACGSGKEYQHCCGQADFEPDEFPSLQLELAEEMDGIVNEFNTASIEPIVLDYILRDSDSSRNRHAFTRIETHDGWMALNELPDMANVHLMAARGLAAEAALEPDSIAKPVACLLLSMCSLEAFINQVAFWLNHVSKLPDGRHITIPPEVVSDHVSFQRNVSFSEKWEIIGGALLPGQWPPPKALFQSFEFLVAVRNETVHFKSNEHEQIVPKPKTPFGIMGRLPDGIETRNIPRSWPNRLFTPSFAKWAVATAEEIEKHFKDGYRKSRFGPSTSA